MATRLGQHSRNLLLGQAFHQLPQLIALSTHLQNDTDLDHPNPRRNTQARSGRARTRTPTDLAWCELLHHRATTVETLTALQM